MRVRLVRWIVAFALAASVAPAAGAEERFITLASTTSTQNSGLFDHLLPLFRKKTGIDVRVVAVGTGQALRLARRGDADVVLVHHRLAEEQLVADGFGVERFDVMYNDFVIIGPPSDPARVAGKTDATEAFRAIADSGTPFISRGDESGTHRKELELWAAVGIDVAGASGLWYRESGSGMGATLNIAAAMNAYTLSDRATWLSFANRGALEVLLEGDPRLFNQYGVILVDPERHPHVKEKDAQTFIDWLTGAEGQAAIAGFEIGGQPAFVPNASP